MNRETKNLVSRRNMLKAGAAGLAVAGLGLNEAYAAREGGAKEKTKIPLGVQVYSVRQQAGKDLPGVLEAIAKMGYAGVEFAGYYGRDANALKTLLKDNGLKCCGTHTGLNTVTGDNLEKTIEFNKTIGNKYLIVPGMSAKGKEGWLEKAKQFNEIAEKLKEHQMVTGYHAHGGDFKKLDTGETGWDVFFGNTNKEVVMQLDVGNCLGGGGDPYAILKKYPGRSVTIHLKEHGGPKEAVVGGGDVKWEQVFEICESTGGTKWYIVEHERGGPDPVADIKRCLEAIKKMGR